MERVEAHQTVNLTHCRFEPCLPHQIPGDLSMSVKGSKLTEIDMTEFSLKTIDSYMPDFADKNDYQMSFEKECWFAKQQLMKNDFTMKTAANNQPSLKGAILNVASIGISLNPASAHAYLVPRDGSVCLDISYKGLVKLATDSGSINWAKAVLVYEGDKFEWNGVNKEPVHVADVFSADRIDAKQPLKNLKGGYCIAQLADGSYMVDTMTAAEILAIKESSKAQNGPWKGKWAGEMAKKTLVKRAYKSWPQSGGRERLDMAVEVLNEHEGIETQETNVSYLQASPDQREKFQELLQADSTVFASWFNSLDHEIQISLHNSFPKGEIGKGKALVKAKTDEGLSLLADIGVSIMETSDEEAIKELAEDLNDLELDIVRAYLDKEKWMLVDEIRAELAA